MASEKVTLRQLASELFDVDDMYLQTIRHQPGMGSEVEKAQRRLCVLDKICDHPDSAVEIPNNADSEALLKSSVDQVGAIEHGPGGEASAVNTIVQSFLQAVSAPTSNSANT